MDTDCKYNNQIDFAQPPQDVLKNNAIYLPITIENVKTWTIFGTGSTSSIISSHLSNLKLKINKCENSNKKILLGQNNNFISRIGQTDKKLKIFYNNITTYSEFEIMEMNKHIHVIIGMDLAFRLKLGITGLASCWDSGTFPKMPDPIDPNPAEPSNSPYGTVEQRTWMQNDLDAYIEANKNISSRSHCNLPESQITLDIDPNVKSAYT
jgi:hypothetical protein